MAPPDIVLIVPTSADVLVRINNEERRKPLTAQQLLDLSIRFGEAAAERMRLDAGQWCPRATDALR